MRYLNVIKVKLAMAFKGSFYYEEDYDLDDSYHNSFEYSADDNLPTLGFNEVISCGFMVISQLIYQFLYLFGVNLLYRIIRQTGLCLIYSKSIQLLFTEINYQQHHYRYFSSIYRQQS